MKRSWTVIVGAKRFAMILMEDCDPVEVVKSIWPEGGSSSDARKTGVPHAGTDRHREEGL